ncbi:thiamine pyrophosphate-dependent dehydrogenase E1 component subunit alpha [Metallosphaera javensis (ex Sakai et al. 2022)]|uniref:thiamine pyrophosphate-dependent dehydrogenase E1 component subunit alpha n=1 Tax=Metallosphaera javensis (ex Sakai et al. 2022) TaxID=2775498 RepID=UPI003CE4B20F
MFLKPEPTVKDLKGLVESAGLTLDQLLEMYYEMSLIREFEEAIGAKYYEGKNPFNMASGPIRGEMHLSSGQEAVAVGVGSNLRKEDVVVSTHRPHHHAIAKGTDVRKLAAEIFGKSTGLCGGKGGHMHLFDKEVRFSCSGIVGASFPQAAGAAFAFKYRGEDNVAVAFAGEGAANHGTFYETLNAASLWELPLILVVEDNMYADSTPKSIALATPHHFQRAMSLNIPSYLVDGMDVIDVYLATRKAVQRARSGGGPSLIEAVTYRFRGHFEGDGQEYRERDEVEMWRLMDPITRLGNRLTKLGVEKERLEERRKKAKEKVDEALKFAEESPYPEPSTALTGVFR